MKRVIHKKLVVDLFHILVYIIVIICNRNVSVFIQDLSDRSTYLSLEEILSTSRLPLVGRAM